MVLLANKKKKKETVMEIAQSCNSSWDMKEVRSIYCEFTEKEYSQSWMGKWFHESLRLIYELESAMWKAHKNKYSSSHKNKEPLNQKNFIKSFSPAFN